MNEVAEYWMTMPEQRIVHSVININLKPLSAAAVINVMSLVEEITNLSLSLSFSERVYHLSSSKMPSWNPRAPPRFGASKMPRLKTSCRSAVGHSGLIQGRVGGSVSQDPSWKKHRMLFPCSFLPPNMLTCRGSDGMAKDGRSCFKDRF